MIDPITHATILLVDDTLENLQLLGSMLEREGYKVRKTTSGKMALQSAHIQPPDLVLLDINMPQMSGYEVCEQLKSSAKTRDIPVIFISALDRLWNKLEAFEVGGVDYITKPFQEQEVLMRVRNQLLIQLQKHQLLQQNQRLEQENQQRRRAEAEVRQLNIHLQERIEARNLALLQALKLQSALAQAQSIASVGNWELDINTGELTWSAELYKIFGRDPTLGAPTYNESLEMYHPADRELLRQVIQRSPYRLPKGRGSINSESYTLQVRLLRSDGSLRYAEIRGRADLNPQGEVVRLFGTVQDITERKQSEAALKASEQKYRSLVENMVDGIYLVNADFQMVYLNPQIETIFGRSLDYFFAEHPWGFLNCVHPDDYKRVKTIFFSGKPKNDLIEVNYRIVRPDGEIRYLRDCRTT